MTIFKKLGHIDTGVEIVPVKAFVENMSTGVSCFEQFVWDLEARGVSNIDIPVLILGVAANWENLPEAIITISTEQILTLEDYRLFPRPTRRAEFCCPSG